MWTLRQLLKYHASKKQVSGSFLARVAGQLADATKAMFGVRLFTQGIMQNLKTIVKAPVDQPLNRKALFSQTGRVTKDAAADAEHLLHRKLAKLNGKHFKARPDQGELDARMSSYELAYRMQMEVPGILDLKGETEKTKEAYGIGDSKTDSFGRKCLLARRLVEKGVRFVQAYAGNWDSHDYIERAHGSLIRSVDKPIAALLGDLKERGLLEDTLVVWCGEFGRTPDNGIRGGGASYGRDHNAKAMTMWFAGGGCKAGHTIGATDEIGAEAVECVHHIRDVHVTWLNLLGLDDNKLTYYHAGRHKQLSQFGGQVIPELIA